jgi:hypothetical protein
MKQVTKEMIDAGHAVLLNVFLKTGHIAMSASLLERIYLSMEQASPQPTAQREWQGLTADEVKTIFKGTLYCGDTIARYEVDGVVGWKAFARAIETKLKEKNT